MLRVIDLCLLLLVIFIYSISAHGRNSLTPSCFAGCEIESCLITSEDGVEADFKENNKMVVLPNCASQQLNKGKVKLLFKGPYGIEQFILDASEKKGSLGVLVKGLASATCLLPEECDTSKYAVETAAIAGKGADKTKLTADGKACLSGMPCGTILPSDTPVSIKIEAGVTDITSIEIKPYRSKIKPKSFAVKDGKVLIDKQFFAEAETYLYSLYLNDNAFASGTYQVTLSDQLRALKEKLPDKQLQNNAETLSLLIKQDFLWDAARLVK